MTNFEWWFASLALLATAFIAWPLLTSKRGQATEGDQRTSRYAPWLIAITALAMPMCAYWLYTTWGAADDWKIQQLNDHRIRQQQQGADPETLRKLNQTLLLQLHHRLQEKPDNLNNQILLARTAVELHDYRRALEAYRHILERQPKSPQVLSEMAQVLFMASGNRFTPEVRQVFDRALALDPGNSRLLGLAGMGAYFSGQFQLAIDYWQRGITILEPTDPRHQTWQRAITEAKRHLEDGEAG